MSRISINKSFNKMNATDPIKHYTNEYQRVAKRLAGHELPWLQQLKAEALQTLAAQGFPTTRHEEWKYTNVAPILKRNFSALPDHHALESPALKRLIADIKLRWNNHINLLCFIDGYFAAELSFLKNTPAAIKVVPLAQALKQDHDLIATYVNKSAQQHTHAFKQLNTLFMQEGAYIYLPAQASLTAPVYLLFIGTEKNAAMTTLRNLIIAEENAGANIIEHYVNLDKTACFTNALTEIFLNNHARLTHYKLQEESRQTFHIGTVEVQQQAHSEFISYSLNLGGALTRSDINVALAGQYAACHLNGLYLASGKQHIDHHTVINHHTTNGISRQNYKGVLNGNARAVFNGKVWVAPGADKTDAQQSNKNLMLSDNAEIDTKPQLEIYADDVKCTHGAAVGQLNEEALFYLRSRGINAREAQDLLIYAFIEEILQKIELPILQQSLQNSLDNFLPDFFAINKS